MPVLLLRIIVLFFALQAGSVAAQSAYFPPGFTESIETDPTTGMSVQVAVGGKVGAPFLVLVHGLGPFASSDWLPVLPALARDYRILLFDLPGFGRSARPQAALTPRHYVRLLHSLIDKHAAEPVYLAGHSLGASIALLHAHTYPRQVERLLLIDAAGILNTAVYTRMITRLPSPQTRRGPVDWLIDAPRRALNHLSGKMQDLASENVDNFVAVASSKGARSMFYRDNSNMNAAIGLTTEDFTPVLGGELPPVWILWGEDDRVAPLRTARALQWLLPTADLTVLPNGGHVPMVESRQFTTRWIQRALSAPEPMQVSGHTAQGGSAGSQGDGVCKGKRDQVFQGHWRSIRLERCANVRIDNAVIGELVAVRSSVDLTRVRIDSPATAIRARGSSITATGLDISAARAMELNNSRADLAAIRVAAPSFGTDRNGSLLFFSLGFWCDGSKEWQLHEVVRPEEGSLDARLRKRGGGACARPGRLAANLPEDVR